MIPCGLPQGSSFLKVFFAATPINVAFAHDYTSELEPVSAGPATTWTVPLCEKGKFVIQPFFFYNRTRGTFNSDGHYDSLPKGFNLMLEFNEFLRGDKREDGAFITNSDIRYLTISPGIGWSCNKIQTLLAYQRTLAGVNTDANDSVVLTFVYTF